MTDAGHIAAAVDTLRFDPVLHFQARLGRSQGLCVDSRSRAPLYMAWGEPVMARHPSSGWEGQVSSGELLFLPRGGRHEVATDPGAQLATIEDMGRTARANGRGTFGIDHPAPCTTLVGSFFWSRELAEQPLIARLPDVVHIREGRCGSQQWLEPMGRLMRWMTDLHHGGAGVGMGETANALLRHVVLALIKDAAELLDDADPLQGSTDGAGVAPALRAIHTAPAEDWSVERLAALCHMSRTAFASRFQRAMRETPLRYLTRWRMTRARQLLADPQLSLDQIAERVGYSSGFAFSKAFKRETQMSPRAAVRSTGRQLSA